MRTRSGRRYRRTNKYLLMVAAVVGVLLLAGCSDGASEHGHGEGGAELAHIHGLGINPGDGKLYVASHHGVFLVTGEDDPKQIAGRTQDFMGFTVVGDDHFLGSGHPGPEDGDQPPHLGLIESTDAAKTWKPVSLSGEVDFHAMEAKHDRVYGWDSQSQQIMVSEDRQKWDRRAQLGVFDIAVSPGDPDVVLATTQEGPQRSDDGGKSFAALQGAPPLVFLDWAGESRLVGVDLEGTVHASADAGESWTERGTASGQPQAILAHGDSEIYVATEEAIHHSTDNGKSFTEFQPLS